MRQIIGDGEKVAEVVELKLWDKASALEKLGKHLRLFDQPEDKNLPPDHLTEYDEDELFERLVARRSTRGRDVTAPKVLEG